MIGRTFSHYHVTERIGHGGMGEVYKAEDTRLRRVVALKFLSPDRDHSRGAKARFLREAQAAAAIDHPHVCPVYDVEETPDGQTFIAMAYCEGETLRERIRSGKLSLREAVRIACEIAEGLAAAHEKGVVHRDLKPSNIMLDHDGAVRIVDFGLAVLAGKTRVTRSGAAVGTFAYMAPEQALGEELDARTDVFSLGIVLYELLTGESPFPGTSDAAILRKIIDESHRPVTEIRPDVPSAVEAVVDRALAKSPGLRYGDAGEMLRALRPAQHALEDDEDVTIEGAGPSPPIGLVARGLAVIAGITALIWVIQLASVEISSRGPPLRGIAVLALTSDVVDQDLRFVLEGLAADLSEYVRAACRNDPSFWVVPDSWVREVGVSDPGRVKGVLGADVLLTVRARSGGDEEELLLALRDAASGETLAEGALDCDTATGFSKCPDSLVCSLLGLEGEIPRSSWWSGDQEACLLHLQGQGRLVRGADDLPRIIALLERATVIDSTFAAAYAVQGEAFLAAFDRGNVDSADRSLLSSQRALDLNHDLIRPRITRARVFLAQGRSAEAISELKGALVVDPQHPDALRWLARTYHRTGRAESAEVAFRQAVDANPRYVGAWEGLGAVLHAKGSYLAALEIFQEARELAPDYGETFNFLGACYLALDCWPRSTEMFERSFELGHNYRACANLGFLYYMHRRFEDAARMYEWALEYDPSSHKFAAGRAAALYWIEGRREESLASYADAAALGEAARRRQGDQPPLLALLAGIYALSDSARATDCIARALKAAPRDPGVLDRATITNEVLGNRERALIHLQDRLDVNPGLATIQGEPFLDSLRADPRFQLITGGVAEAGCRVP